MNEPAQTDLHGPASPPGDASRTHEVLPGAGPFPFVRPWGRTLAGWGVWALLAFTVVALLGYGIFGRNPQLIPPSLIGFWQISYAFFARFHIIVGGVAMAMALWQWAGLRWIPAAVAVYLLSFTAEHVGTGFGLPFGAYEYTSLLGTRIGDRVPWVIPLSWFLMVLPAWVLARATFPVREARDDRGGVGVPPRDGVARVTARLVFAAVILTIWDLALDPAMAYQAPLYWTWGDTGPYYGMPWINLAGWVGTGVVLMAALELLGIRRWGGRIDPGWALWYYSITVLMPLGMLVIEGLWLAVVVTAVASAGAWAFHRWVLRRRGTDAPWPLQGAGDPPLTGAAGTLAPGPTAGAAPALPPEAR